MLVCSALETSAANMTSVEVVESMSCSILQLPLWPRDVRTYKAPFVINIIIEIIYGPGPACLVSKPDRFERLIGIPV